MNRKTALYLTTPIIISIILTVHFTTSFEDTTKTPSYGLIGIQLSKTCEIELKYHMNTTCFNYHDLLKFDNTDPSWAGNWTDTPFFHRLNPKISNSHLNGTIYPWIIMVDPNSNFQQIAHLIIINPGNFTWVNPDDTSLGGMTYKIHNNRMNSNCQTLIVAPNMWLINDTINYIKSGCLHTSYNDTSIFVRQTPPNIMDNPYASWHYTNMIYSLKKSPVQDCIHHICNQPDPYKKKGW